MQQDISEATFFSRLFNMASVVIPSFYVDLFSMLEGCISIVDENGCSIIMTLPDVDGVSEVGWLCTCGGKHR
jgi:hypothetical protein